MDFMVKQGLTFGETWTDFWKEVYYFIRMLFHLI